MESPSPAVRLAFYSIQPDGYEIDKSPVLFLHGVTGCKEYWNDIPRIVANTTKRKVFVLDLRNHGDSEWSEDFSFLNYANDVLQFMNSIHAPKVIFVGHSLGGFIAMRIAGIASGRVEKLVVEDLCASKTDPSVMDTLLLHVSLLQKALEQMPEGLGEDAARQFIDDFVDNGYTPDMKKLPKLIDGKQYDNTLKPTQDDRYTYRYNIDAIQKALTEEHESSSATSGVYSGPTCFIYGQKSLFKVDKDEENIRKYFPSVEMVPIENAAHCVHKDCPEKFTEALLKFI
ncbi:hypothetical protein JTE90_011837 [Oedothorax gibbosus]|uniref:sn-1-specific diacylglycerol lipase ABHD11 n=1 Tax=Oedothorax gibbosus TaxID=931172 RepID=A0AAV6U144_9ARAC|nr:hypothetical protein JTE90_011837 [Oedothorax gibbosus]